MPTPSNIIDSSDRNANMYGCHSKEGLCDA